MKKKHKYRYRILIIDDEKTLVQTLVDRFEKHDFDVQSAFDNDVALDLIQKEQYDLIMQNMNRPFGKCLENINGEFSGVLFYQKYIRQLCPKVPVIFYSAHAHRMPKEIQTLDSCTAISIPFDLTELLISIKSILDQSEKEKESRTMKNFWQTGFSWIFTVYFFSVGIFVLYFNWTYARENGFTKWLLLGEVVATAKAVVWPYFVFSANSETNYESPDAQHFINSKKAYDEALLIVDKAGDVTKLPDAQKTEFAGFVKLSIAEAKKVQPEYLQEAHPDYYKMYETKYISGMDLMLQGIEADNMALILEGAIKCNEFSDWLHEHKREFKN